MPDRLSLYGPLAEPLAGAGNKINAAAPGGNDLRGSSALRPGGRTRQKICPSRNKTPAMALFCAA